MALSNSKKIELIDKLEKQRYEDVLNLEKSRIDDKNRYGRLTRYMNSSRREMIDYNRLFSDNDDEQNNKCTHNADDSETINKTIENKREEIKDFLLRQQLRENCPELRELESKLRCAYVSKEIAAQIAEKKVAKLNEKLRLKRESEIVEEAFKREKQRLQNIAQDDILKKAKYKQELQDQIIYKEKLKRFLYEEYLREKIMIDDIVQRIYEEDQRMMEDKMLQMRRTRDDMIKFKEAQEIWRRNRKSELERENIKIQEYLLLKESETKTKMDEKLRKDSMKQEIIQKMSKEIFEKNVKQKEREDILQNLREEELKDEEERKYREVIHNQLRQRLEMRETLTDQIQEKQKKLRKEAEEDARYKQELMVKMAEDQRLEQLSAHKKRLKMMQLKKDIEEMITVRRQKRAEEMTNLVKLREKEQLELNERKRIIEEERIRLLKEHVHNLIGFLPKGLLTSDDLPFLGIDTFENQNKMME